MSKSHKFRSVIQNAGGGGMFVEVPLDVESVFHKKRVPVKATIDGQPYRGSIVSMGKGRYIIGVLKEIREKIGKGAGDEVEITVQEDDEPRTVEVPKDLKAALDKTPRAGSRFKALSYSHQREYVRWILEAKQPETRQRRIGQTITKLEKKE